MAADVGDEPLSTKRWAASDPRFRSLAGTTWTELEEKALVVPTAQFGAGAEYHLTGAGWIEGLSLAGAFDDPDFRARGATLVQFLKHAVDGRQGSVDAIISYHSLPKEPSREWVLSALNSGLLNRVFSGKRMNARWDPSTRSVRVPVTFGMPVD